MDAFKFNDISASSDEGGQALIDPVKSLAVSIFYVNCTFVCNKSGYAVGKGKHISTK